LSTFSSLDSSFGASITKAYLGILDGFNGTFLCC
jgi:hypothetical protein